MRVAICRRWFGWMIGNIRRSGFCCFRDWMSGLRRKRVRASSLCSTGFANRWRDVGYGFACFEGIRVILPFVTLDLRATITARSVFRDSVLREQRSFCGLFTRARK
jgi:hypothetical protein